MDDLISIIVRVYNVEPYLRQCLDSIVSQTYDNLQIIVVDDGSTDGCGMICDEYAAQDKRVEVFHLPNGGQATARNYAVEKSRGQWVGFVDGDDWIAPDMLEKMLMAVTQEDADMAVCGVIYAYRDGTNELPITTEYKVLDSKEAAMDVCFGGNQLRENIWNKLVKKSCIPELYAPKWQSYQDMLFLTEFLLKTNRIVLLDSNLYYYRQQMSSVVHSVSMRNASNRWRTVCEKYHLVAKRYPKYAGPLIKECFWAAVLLWRDADLKAAGRKKQQSLYAEVSQFARDHHRDFQGTMQEKASAWCVQYNSQWSFALIHFVFWIKRKTGRAHDGRFQPYE